MDKTVYVEIEWRPDAWEDDIDWEGIRLSWLEGSENDHKNPSAFAKFAIEWHKAQVYEAVRRGHIDRDNRPDSVFVSGSSFLLEQDELDTWLAKPVHVKGQLPLS